VEMANYPFTTIDPNRGVAHARTRCPCTDRDADCGICREGARYVPVELVDIAGLVPGAHTGRGLGNQFLDALTTAEAIVTVIDAAGATTAEGEPVAVGTTDPLEEVAFIEEELEAWMAQIIADNWSSVRRSARAPGFDLDGALADVLSGLGITDHVITAVLREAEYPTQVDAWGDGEFTMLAQAVRQRAKPIVICANKVDLAPSANIAGKSPMAIRMLKYAFNLA
ncbi:MAG: GTPase, partial [Haloferacaceae archaeon]|nr:GTPase [Haloferacaceae archaeon]